MLTCGLRAEASSWAAGATQSDDVTVLVLEYDGDGSTRDTKSTDEASQGTSDVE